MIAATLCALTAAAAPLSSSELAAFRGDVDFVVATIEKTHPAPFSRTNQAGFLEDADALKAQSGESEGCAVAQLMALTAELHDGHSYIDPINAPGLRSWFPVRFYWIARGLYVTAVAPEYAELVGKRVVTIGGLTTAQAMEKVLAIQGANNPLAGSEGTVWLSNAALAQALGAADARGMTVAVEDNTGGRVSRTLAPIEGEVNDSWNQQGEIFGPRFSKDAQPYVTAFGGRGPLDFRKNDPALPPHLRYRLPYFLVEMPEAKLLYFQWNFVQEWKGETFEQFTRRLFATLDAHPDWKLVIDVRYNSGGDGTLVPPFIRQIIKRDRFDEPGNLYVLIGRKTFSAAVDFVGEAKGWTSAIFVGEPSGAGLNAYGDAQDFESPGLHIRFQVSTAYHQHAPSADQGGEFDPDIPAIMTAADYFAGRDPALETVGKGKDSLPLPVLALQQGAASAKAALARRKAEWGTIAWWTPFREQDLNRAAYRLLESGKTADAVVAFQMNADQFPDSWNAWDSLGEAERAAGDLAAARRDYGKSLALNPGNGNARAALADMTAKGS